MKTEIKIEQHTQSAGSIRYSWLVAVLLTCTQISNQWNRFVIGSAYYYTSTSPKYNMQEAIPALTSAKYGLVTGLIFNTPFSIMVLMTGTIAQRFNRKYLLGIASLLWSLSSYGMATTTSLSMVFTFRVVLGTLEAFNAPCCYSLIVDYFPADRRTFANSVYATGGPIGAAVVSLSVIFVELLGWRYTYVLVGSYGILIAILVLLLV